MEARASVHLGTPYARVDLWGRHMPPLGLFGGQSSTVPEPAPEAKEGEGGGGGWLVFGILDFPVKMLSILTPHHRREKTGKPRRTQE